MAASSLAVLHSGFANADARFGFPTEIDTSDGTIQEVQFADIDGDGDPDLISNAYLDSTISWYENRDDGTFSTRQVINTNTAQAEEVHPADVDGDGDLDLVVYKAGEDRIVWYSNTGSGFHADTNQPGISIATTPNESMSLAVADLDVDGDVDVIMASATDSAISWFENPGSGIGWSPHSIATSSEGWHRVKAADVDRDGDDDLVAVHRENETVGTLTWHENDGTALFANSYIIGEVDSNSVFVAADLDNDDDLDLASPTINRSGLNWFRNEGASEAWTEHYVADLVLPRSLQASDLNNDGAVDLLVGENSSVRWFSNLGSGNFSAGQEIASSGSHDLATADIDSDGDLDVAVADYPSGSVLTYPNWGISPGYRTVLEPVSSELGGVGSSVTVEKIDETIVLLAGWTGDSDGYGSRAWFATATAQSWNSPGDTQSVFQSQTQNDSLGKAVAFNPTAKRIAIGAYNRVEVYEWTGNSWCELELTGDCQWMPVGEPISRQGVRSIAFSENGARIAIGSDPPTTDSGTRTGTVDIVEWDAVNSAWTQVGNRILGNHGESLGASISMSSDGNRVLAGGDGLYFPSAEKGVARVYELHPATSTWVQVGSDQEGSRPGDRFGASAAMSADGNRVVIGAPGYDGESGTSFGEGLVQVYDFADTQWVLVGQFSQGGTSVDVTSDGNRLAFGGPLHPAQLHDWDAATATWRQLTLESESARPMAGTVSLSQDGDVLAVGESSTVAPRTNVFSVQDSVFIDFFDANGTFMGRQFGEGRSEVTATVTPPVREGYTFAGWAAQPDGSGSAYSADENVRMPRSGKLDLYAQWDINTVYLSYNPQGGTGEPADQTGDAATTITISTTQPTRTGYTFTGWNTRADGTGTNYNANDTYTLPQSGTNTLYAQWRLAAHGFTDVPTAGWQNDAVVWMKTSGVTTGCGTETFCPDVAMTREQQVTFLYRYGGEPDPGNVNPFSDVARGRYFSEAIDWAYNSGITTGYAGTGRFGTGDHVTRAQAVTMLWRQAGQPSPSGVSPFIDVERGRYFTDAVAWAFEAGVTTGTSSTTFSPGDPVTRVQFAAFLSRFDRLD